MSRAAPGRRSERGCWHILDPRYAELLGPNRNGVLGHPPRIAVWVRAAGDLSRPLGAAAARQHSKVVSRTAGGLEIVDAGESTVDQAPAQPDPRERLGKRTGALVGPYLVEPGAARPPVRECRRGQQRDPRRRMMTADRRKTPGGQNPVAERAVLDNQNALIARHARVRSVSMGRRDRQDCRGAVTTRRANAGRPGRQPPAPRPSAGPRRFPRASRTAPWS